MDKKLIEILLLAIMSCVFVWYSLKKKKPKEKIDISIKGMQYFFFQELKNNQVAYRIAYIYSIFDIIIIKSIFESEEIPYFIEFENSSRIRTGLPVTQINNSILNVLEKDYHDAIFVLEEYIKTKEINIGYKNKIRNIVEMLLFSKPIPSTNFNTIRILKINMNKK